MKKLNRLTTVITLCLLLIACGCRRNATSEAAPKPLKRGNVLFVTDISEPLNTEVVEQEVSFMKPHKVILRLCDLEPGRGYQMNYKLTDADGSEVTSGQGVTTPTEKEWFIYDTVQPELKKHKPGKWCWSFGVKGVGSFTVKFTVLPPTPADLENLARHEQAREEAFRAFSKIWVGHGDCFFTYVSVNTNTVRRGLQFVAPPYNPKGLLQVTGLDYQFTQSELTDADKLNGLTYRGAVSFGLRAYREWSPENGWFEWKNSSSSGNFYYSAVAAKLFGDETIYFSNRSFDLAFTIEQRDGDWWVITPSGDKFVNGTKTFTGQGDIRLEQPNLDLIRALADQQGKQRSDDQRDGVFAKSSPEDIARNEITTMTMLRGRSL